LVNHTGARASDRYEWIGRHTLRGARSAAAADDWEVADQATRFYVLFGGMLLLGMLALLLRWTWGTGRDQRVPDPDDPTGDGLLEEVSRVPTEPAAQVLRDRLREAGIRATVGRVQGGYRLLVFHRDLVDARVVLSRGALE
jgi:hypothetical protein